MKMEYNKKEKTLRFGSYNIRHGVDAGYDMSKFAKNILNAQLDIVGLQEVDQKTSRVNGMDTIKNLSQATGYKHYAFFKTIDFLGGEYGTAILSKYPIIDTERILLESGIHEQRVLGRAEINVDGTTVNFFVTHLSFESLDIRTAQFKQIANVLKRYDDFVLVGDFNTPDFNEYSVIENSKTINNREYSLLTFPEENISIDNIVYSVDSWEFSLPKTLTENCYSDHYMLYAEGENKKKNSIP